MTKYIAILRGINVGGNRKILMTDLKLLLKKIGFKNSTTYIQSGNVVFYSDMPIKEIEKVIKQEIFEKYGFDIPVLVRTVNEIEIVFNNNPFLQNKTDINKLYVAFLSDIPTKENLEKLNIINFDDDKYMLIGKHLYICYGEKLSTSKLSNNIIEKKLNVTATCRNWKTVAKLFELSHL